MRPSHRKTFVEWLGAQTAMFAKRATVGPLYPKPVPAQTPGQGRAVAKPQASNRNNMGSAAGTGLIGGDLFKQEISDNKGTNGVVT